MDEYNCFFLEEKYKMYMCTLMVSDTIQFQIDLKCGIYDWQIYTFVQW